MIICGGGGCGDDDELDLLHLANIKYTDDLYYELE
jgi:hypothetical protein